MTFTSVSIVICAFNEEKYIGKTLDEVLKADTFGLKKEIIIVNDGSLDKTDKIINAKVKIIDQNKTTSCKIIQKKTNEGKGAALRDGLIKTNGDIVIVQDADLEYSPDNYLSLIEPFLKNDADVVYGSRFISNKPRRILYYWHYLGNLFLTNLSNMMTNLNLTDMETGYKIFRGDLIRKIAPHLKSKKFGFEPEITARIAKIKNIKIYEVGISYWGRTYNEGKKIGWKDGIRAVGEIIKFNLFVRKAY